MSFRASRNQRKPVIVWLATLIVMGLFLTGCETESSRQTATSEARGTPETTITPAGNPLIINGETVIQAFVPDPDQAALYALTHQNLYAWHDRQWEVTPAGNDGRAILVDQNNPDRLFRGDHPVCGQETESEPIQFEISEDAGQTWKVLPMGRNVRPLAIDPVFPEVIYGTDCSLRISTNRGGSWRYLEALYQHELVDLVVVGERLLVLGVSTQGDSQVRELRLTSPEDPQISDIIIQVPGIASVDADMDRIAVGGPGGVRTSLDGGQTWALSRTGLESVTMDLESAQTPNPSIDRPNRQFGVLTIEIDPTHSHRIFAGTVRGLYISQDDGGTWDLYDEIDTSAWVTDVRIASGGADIVVTTDTGVVIVPNP